MSQHKYKIIISGGGTGGHIFPAIAIANALKKIAGNIDILFIGARGRIEMEKVPAAGYPIEGLWISGFRRSLAWQNLLFPVKLICSLLRANSIIKRYKPDVVIGVGGYASGPTLKMAARQGIPTIIQEQNSLAGVTNRLLAQQAARICVAYDHMERFFPAERIIKTGNPVRKEVIHISGKREEAMKYFGFQERNVNILVVGGSQGAMSINKAVADMLDFITDKGLNLLWQTGKTYHQAAQGLSLDGAHPGVKPVSFIERMDLAYAYADIIISRAGAIAISEICAVGKAAIFIPLPTAAEDHQMKNAQALASENAALVINDNESRARLPVVLEELVNDTEKQQDLARQIARLAITNADERIAEEVINLINKSNES